MPNPFDAFLGIEREPTDLDKVLERQRSIQDATSGKNWDQLRKVLGMNLFEKEKGSEPVYTAETPEVTVSGVKPEEQMVNDPTGLKTGINKTAEDTVAYDQIPAPKSFETETPESLYAKSRLDLLNKFEAPVMASYHAIGQSFVNSFTNIRGGLKDLTDDKFGNDFKGYGKLLLGGVSGVLNFMPALIGLNALQPHIEKNIPNLAESLGVDPEWALKTVNTAIPFVFGKWVGAGSITAEGVTEGIKESGVEMSPTTEQAIHDLIFFTIAGVPHVKNMLSKSLTENNALIKKQIDTYSKEVFTGNKTPSGGRELSKRGVEDFTNNLYRKEVTPQEKEGYLKILKDNGVDVKIPEEIKAPSFREGQKQVEENIPIETPAPEGQKLLEEKPDVISPVTKKIVAEHSKSGGSTTFSDGSTPTTGYVVSTYPNETLKLTGSRPNIKMVQSYRAKNNSLLNEEGNAVGTWYNKAEDTTYLDIVKIVPDKNEALRLGRESDQLAIWHLDKGEEIPVTPATPIEHREEIQRIEPNQLQEVHHFSDSEKGEITLNPKKFGANSYTGNDIKRSRMPRTFLYTSAKAVKNDHVSLRDKNHFTGKVDMSKFYDLDENPESVGFNEYGVFVPEDAMKQVKKKGYQGVKYGEILASFKPVLVSRVTAPTPHNIMDGTWNESVQEAKKSIAEPPKGQNPYSDVVGKKLISDLAIIASDRIMHQNKHGERKAKGKVGTEEYFVENVFNKMLYPEQLDKYARYARSVYEMTKRNMTAYRADPFDKTTMDELTKAVNDNIDNVEDYVPVNKVLSFVGLDSFSKKTRNEMDEVVREQQQGAGFPEQHALFNAKQSETETAITYSGMRRAMSATEVGEPTYLDEFNFKNKFTSVDVVEGQEFVKIEVSGVNDQDMINKKIKEEIEAEGGEFIPKGQGHGYEVYQDVVSYANAVGKKLQSDTVMSKYSWGIWNKLKQKYGDLVTKIPDSQIKVQIGVDGKPYLHTSPSGKPIWTLDAPKIKPQDLEKRTGAVYPVHAVGAGVARALEKYNDLAGGNTVALVQYPKVWEAMTRNYEFHDKIQGDILQWKQEMNDENLRMDSTKEQVAHIKKVNAVKVPDLPPIEAWKGMDGEGKKAKGGQSSVSKMQDQYIKGIKATLAQIKSIYKTNAEKKKWGLNAIALRHSRENAENFAGTIYGVFKYHSKTKVESEKITTHKSYPFTINGWNYLPMKPIPFALLVKEIKDKKIPIISVPEGSDTPTTRFTKGNEPYLMLQRVLGLQNDGQSEIVSTIMDYATTGNKESFNKWFDKNPNYVDYIYDIKKHNEYLDKHEAMDKVLADKFIPTIKEFEKKFKEELDKARVTREALGKGEHRPSPPKSPYPDNYFNESGGFSAGIDPLKFIQGLGTVAKAIGRGAKTIAEFSQRMIKELGEWVRPFLRDLWMRVTQMPNIFKKVSPQEAQRVRTENANAPKEPTATAPEVTNKKKDETYSWNYQESLTKGYNIEKEHPLLGKHVASILDEMRVEFDKNRRGTISNEDLLAIAKDRATQLTDNDILNVNVGDVRNAEDIVAMRIYVADKLLKINEEVAKFAGNADPITIKSMSSELAKGMKMYIKTRALGTEAGRAVQSFNIPMDDVTIDAMRSLTTKLRELDPDDRYGGDIVSNMIDELSATPKSNVDKAVQLWEATRFAYLNYILSNPLTDMANVSGNGFNLGFHIVANIGNLGGSATLKKGLINGIKEGGADALKVLHGEIEAMSKFTENNHTKLPSGKNNWDWLKLAVPTMRLAMEDAFFRGLIRNVELERMTTKLSDKYKVNPNDLKETVIRGMNDPELLTLEPQYVTEMATYLKRIEDELVFQKELGRVGKGFSLISKVAYPIIPFVKTPANILKFGVSATPLGFAKLLGKDVLPEEKNQIIRRALLGSTVLTGIGVAVANGLIELTGGGSDDAYERDLMEKMGYKPNHIYVWTPDGMYGGSYQNVNPMNVPLATAGDLFDKYRFNKKEKKDDKAWYDKWAEDASIALIGLAGSITDQSFLTGVKGFCDFIANRNPDWGIKNLTNFGRIPPVQGFQKVTGTLDRGQYNTKGRMLEQIQKNSPFSHEGLIKSINTFGGQRMSTNERFLLPISKINDDQPQYRWLADMELDVPQVSPTTKIGNREMNRKEYEIYANMVGTAMDKGIKVIYEKENDPENEDKLTQEEIQDKIDSFYTKAKKKAKELIIQKIIETHKIQEEKTNETN